MDCIVPNFGTRRNKTLHVFPKSEVLGREWLKAVQAPKLAELTYDIIRKKQYRVCFRHFEKTCYIATFQKPRLKDNAIPTIYLPNRPIESADEIEEIVPIHSLKAIENLSDLVIIDNDSSAEKEVTPGVEREVISCMSFTENIGNIENINLPNTSFKNLNETENEVSIHNLKTIKNPNESVVVNSGYFPERKVASGVDGEGISSTSITENLDTSTHSETIEEIGKRIVKSKTSIKIQAVTNKINNAVIISSKNNECSFGVKKRIRRRLLAKKTKVKDYTPKAKKFLLEVTRLRKNLYKKGI